MTIDFLLEQIRDLKELEVSKYVGVTIFFMWDNYIVKGKITGFDNYQLFVQSKSTGFGISYNKKFFLKEEDLIEDLVKTKLDLIQE